MLNKYYNSVSFGTSLKTSTLVLFFIWPLASLYISFKNYKQIWAKNILWLFCGFFGYTLIIGGEGGADSARYAELFIYYAHSDLSLTELWRSFYTEGTTYTDIFAPLLTYMVSRITDNPSVLFTIFGLIFGYFYSRNIWYLLDRISGKVTSILLLYLVTFALLNPIWNINGFRMYAAAQIFIFGALPYLFEGKNKGLIWSCTSVFVHFSFILPIAILILFVLLKNRLNIYLGFFLLTAFIKEIDLEGVRSALSFSFLPEVFQQRVAGYTNLDYAESRSIINQSLNWYVPFSDKVLTWVNLVMMSYVYFFCRKFLDNRKDLRTLLCFSLLLGGFANISSLIPAGGRFLMVTNIFMFAFLIFLFSAYPKIRGLQLMMTLSSPFLLIFCIVIFRMGMDYCNLITILGNPLSAAIYSDTVPLITGIKQLLS